jgi:hypothetical protein
MERHVRFPPAETLALSRFLLRHGRSEHAMSTAELADHLNMGLELAHWSTTELWLAAVALGTDLAQVDIASIRTGERAASRVEYELLAVALNEHFSDRDMNHSMLQWADLHQS